MRFIFIAVFSLVSIVSFSSEIDFNEQKGYVAEGYDVVAYFQGKAVEGEDQFKFTHEGLNYMFSSAKNLETFKASPAKYIPQYGGWCAYAMAINGDKVSINPETFEIRNGKLYLFYNAFLTNTLKSWLEENPNQLLQNADVNWENIGQ